MKSNRTIAVVLLAAGLAWGVAACDEDKSVGAPECDGELYLEVGDLACDCTPEQVQCYYQLEQDGTEYVGCDVSGADTASGCGLEVAVGLVDGEADWASLTIHDAEENEIEGAVNIDEVVFTKDDTQLSLSLGGTMDHDSSLEVRGCFTDLEWIEGTIPHAD